MKVPTITTARTAILTASFAFILTFIVLLLRVTGKFLLGLSVASAFIESKSCSKLDEPGRIAVEAALLMKRKG